ncbi:hypothetical protein TNCV_2322001 [Trichonephila clavipes]|nr:hypothetical protein TNCV_2322001 [Trichonephila clavipes]
MRQSVAMELQCIANQKIIRECLVRLITGKSRVSPIKCLTIPRFVNNPRRTVKANGPLEADELDKAKIFLINDVQRQEFSVDIKCLHNNNEFCPRNESESFTSLGNGMRNVPPSHIEMHLGLEVERPGLRGSFLIGGLEGARGCGYSDFFGDIRCDGKIFFRVNGQEIRLLLVEKNQ